MVWEKFTGAAQSYFEAPVLPLFDGSGTIGIFCETPMRPDAVVKISHIESDNHYSVIHTDYGRSYRSYISLSTLYEQLADRENFIMVGKSYVINTIHIKMFTKEEVALRENVSIPVPVRLQKMIYETLTTQMS